MRESSCNVYYLASSRLTGDTTAEPRIRQAATQVYLGVIADFASGTGRWNDYVCSYGREGDGSTINHKVGSEDDDVKDNDNDNSKSNGVHSRRERCLYHQQHQGQGRYRHRATVTNPTTTNDNNNDNYTLPAVS